ncbi:HAD domain-containing protein [Lactovum miscens]|uniref:HAD domain-containing protein n=1 Tax=Lactovum miscens TaxID=190387 RepID=UPI0039C8E96E
MLYILLDIDGTILPTHISDKSHPSTKISLDISETNLPLSLYEDITNELVKISHSNYVKIIMCSSWGETSIQIAQYLGIKSDEYLVFFNDNPKQWYKWQSIVNFCETHPKDKIILCDDLASYEVTRHKPHNLIKIFQPNPQDGLTMKDLHKIWKFVNKQK